MSILDEIKNGESKILEFKEKITSHKKLAQSVVAFSNTSGGKIIIGIDKNINIVGVDSDKLLELQDKVSSIIYDLCYPNILPEIYSINIENKNILVIEIFRGSLLPYYLKNKGKRDGTYIRIGATNRPADEDTIVELERQKKGKSFDEEENFNFDIKKLDLKIIYNEFKKINKKCDYEKLKNLKLIKKYRSKNYPTNALLIVLGEMDNTNIKCAKFKGKTKNVFIDKKEFYGNLFDVLENTISFLKNHLNLSAEINEIKRKEEYEIPIVALREILLNAIIHRDYTRNSDIKVAIFDDIVEITSPGSLPNGMIVADAINGRSELRNKILANLFKELGYVESWGSGLERVFTICKEKNIKFIFKEEGNFIRCMFNRPQKTTYNIKKVPESAELMPENAEKVLEFLKFKLKITVNDAKKIFNVKERRARDILVKLAKEGYIRKIGKTKGSYYILSTKMKTRKNNQNS